MAQTSIDNFLPAEFAPTLSMSCGALYGAGTYLHASCCVASWRSRGAWPRRGARGLVAPCVLPAPPAPPRAPPQQPHPAASVLRAHRDAHARSLAPVRQGACIHGHPPLFDGRCLHTHRPHRGDRRSAARSILESVCYGCSIFVHCPEAPLRTLHCYVWRCMGQYTLVHARPLRRL